MPLITLKFRPGIDKEVTNYANKGGWVACDHIRFRRGHPEKIGGYSTWLGSGVGFNGVARTIFPWVTYDVQTLLAMGTNQKYYVYNDANGSPNDITPIDYTQGGLSDPFVTVADSPLVTVTDASHGATAGTFVTFSGLPTAGINGIQTLGTQLEILEVLDSNTYTVIAPTPATSSGGTTGVTGISVTYLIPAGNAITTTSTSGWGLGPWGGVADATFTGYISDGTGTTPGNTLTVVSLISGAIGVGPNIGGRYVLTGTTILSGTGPYNVDQTQLTAGAPTPVQMTSGTTGWGIGAASATGVQLLPTIWSQTNTGQDLVFARQYDKPYYWVKNTSAYGPGVSLASYSGTQNKITKATTIASLASTSNITVTDTLFIDPGAIVTGSNIPSGTYVLPSWNGSNTIPLSSNITTGGVASGATISFSYSQYAVPVQVGQIFGDPNGFIVAVGANPYSPTAMPPNAYTTYDPMLVRWSDQNNPYDWVPTTFNQAGSNHLQSGSYLVAGRATRQENLIWSNSALYSMQYVGPPYVYSFTLMADNISIISPNAAITVNNITFWMGVDKFYVYNGQVQPLPCTLRNFVFQNINTAQSVQVVCGINVAYNEIWWHYPSSSSLVNDTYVVFNYLDNVWYYGSMFRTAWLGSELFQPNPLSVISVQNSYLNASITSSTVAITLYNTRSYPTTGVILIDSELIQFNNPLDGRTLNATTRGYGGTTAAAHNIYATVTNVSSNQVVQQESGLIDSTYSLLTTPINAYIRSSDIDIGDGENYVFVWRIVPDLTFTSNSFTNDTVTMTITPRANPGSAYMTGTLQNNTLQMTGQSTGITDPWGNYTVGTNAPVSTLTQVAPTGLYNYPVEQFTGQVYTRVRGRQFTFQIQSTGLSVTWQLGDMRIDYRLDGRR